MYVSLIVFNVYMCIHPYISGCMVCFTHTRMCTQNLELCLPMPTKPILLLEKSLNHLTGMLCIADV